MCRVSLSSTCTIFFFATNNPSPSYLRHADFVSLPDEAPLFLFHLPSSLSVVLSTHTQPTNDVPFYFIRGYEFFHPRRATTRVSPLHQPPPPRHRESLKMERGADFVLVGEGRSVYPRDNQVSSFLFFSSFLKTVLLRGCSR